LKPLRILCATTISLLLLGAASARAVTLQPIGSFDDPIYVTSDPGNPNRLFVAERTGKIQQVAGGATTLFADLSPVTQCGGSCNGETGLYSIALAPDFDTSGRLYFDYANSVDGTLHVDEVRQLGETASPGTVREVLTIAQPPESNHGGQLQFGPEGDLFVSTGDDEAKSEAQSLSSLLGKILRIDPLPSGAMQYSVPPGNPFAANPPPYDTIWSYGLRNPFRFSFDRLGGGIAIGDPGVNSQEEVDYSPAPQFGAGANYGWDCFEAFLPGPGTGKPECSSPPAAGYTPPIFDYVHNDPGSGAAHGCAIIGGYVVRDPSLDGLYGRYLYADHCLGELRSFELAAPFATDRSEGIALGEFDSFGEDSCGRLYTVAGSQVSRLVGSEPRTCAASAPLGVSYMGIRAQHRKVKRRGRALITAWVSPCKGRKGEPVKLFRGRKHIGTRRLDLACSVRFRPRIVRRASFRAKIGEDTTYVASTSRKLRIRVDHRRRANRR
jgi:hypothetical protein